MKRGHVAGTKKEREGSTDWYCAIEEANIQRVEAAWLPPVAPVSIARVGRYYEITIDGMIHTFITRAAAQAHLRATTKRA